MGRTSATTGGGKKVKTPTDGVFTDGLFAWVAGTTLVADALDDVNEVLNSLAPSPAPSLDDIDIDTNGTDGRLSFDTSNPIAEGTYFGCDGIGSRPAVAVDADFDDSGDRAGIIDASTDVTGTLNEDVAADSGSPNPSYPANAFGNADQGDLKLELNGVVVRTIDLSTAGAVNDGTATSGFNITDHTDNLFPNGDPFTQFQNRTGSFRIDSGDMRLGWNYARVIHTISGSDTETNYVDWVVDANASTTSYSGIALDTLSMSGSESLSGVEYHTGGTAQYDVTIDNAQRNTYKSGSPVTFNETNGSISNQALSATAGNELQTNTYTNLTFTVSGSRILDGSIATTTSVDRTINANEATSSSASITGLLMDTNISGASGEDDNDESFNAEGYRLTSDLSLTDTTYSTGAGNGPVAGTWDATESLVGADSGHNDGLLSYNGALRYPTEGANSGNFGAISNGPAGNPNYSAASGNRVYLRYFYDSTTRQNFLFNFTASSTSFVSVATGPSGNNLTCEILAPNTTQDSGSTVEFKDMVTAYTDDDSIGAYSASVGSTIPTSWGATLGTRSTATSGNAIVIRITASSSWTGNISAIDLTFP